MKLSKMPKEELELYSYIDLTKMILEENKKPLNTAEIFKNICTLLEMNDDEYAEKIGAYYTSLTTDKDFVLLNDGNWDLRDRHSVQVILEDDDEIDEEEIDEFEEEIDETDDIDSERDDLILDDEEDEVEELTILTEEELEEE